MPAAIPPRVENVEDVLLDGGQVAARRVGGRETGTLDDADEVDPVDVLRWPGVIQHPEMDIEPLFDEASSLLDAALEQMAGMRASEGERIGAMIDARLEDILSIASSVRARMPEVLDAVRAKQQERIDKLDIEADPARLETELALIAQKLDVDEELDRLESHVSEVRTALGSDEPVGRRLDFLMQELLRETNTLGSKSPDTDVAHTVVAMKSCIDRIKEQVANLE